MPPPRSPTRRYFAVAVTCLLAGCSPRLEVPVSFVATPVTLETYGLFDLGVTDADSDGRLDVFTSNHSGPQSLALNRGELRFEEGFGAWGLDQDPRLPGLAVVPADAAPDGPGFYVGWRGAELVVRAHALGEEGARITGTIELYSAATVTEKAGFDVVVDSRNLAPRVNHSVLSFSGTPNGYFVFRPEQHSVPIEFRLTEGVSPRLIRIGPQRASPGSTAFLIRMRDRHGMAWADYDGDRDMDLFITRGGIQGTMKYVPLPFWDELLVNTSGKVQDVGPTAGLEKHGCPGREAAWEDFDRDGRLDLYVVCGRDGSGEDFPNQLFRQDADGAFRDVASAVGLDLAGEGKFAWTDDDGDGDTDLLWVDRDSIYRYENRKGSFLPHLLESLEIPIHATGLRAGDANGDGRDDLFVVSAASSRLLLRGDAGFTVVDPASLGLPSRNLAAGFVDVDNDGVEEFHSLPTGLYRRQPEGGFLATGEFSWIPGRFAYLHLTEAHLGWADIDGDGTRDLLIAANTAPKKGRWASWIARMAGDASPTTGPLRGQWTTRIIANPGSDSHWLQVDLVGPPGNRQGIGARVDLQTAAGTRAHEVGHAESSSFSQGHYRVYFGLGREAAPERVSVHWPDGSVQVVERPAADQRIAIAWAEGRGR